MKTVSDLKLPEHLIARLGSKGELTFEADQGKLRHNQSLKHTLLSLMTAVNHSVWLVHIFTRRRRLALNYVGGCLLLSHLVSPALLFVSKLHRCEHVYVSLQKLSASRDRTCLQDSAGRARGDSHDATKPSSSGCCILCRDAANASGQWSNTEV